ncbi:HEAT repeat domain-containing protein [Actinospongicola halichondriae]|uniref:HEAT repeat domain-containing protein n=1 Tax=Actinospongicola halichondriae TaxID=3236844 RepID=UPI003D4B69D9
MSADAAARRRVAAVAGHSGDVDTARSMLDDESSVVRSTALGALARLDAVEDTELETALSDPDSGVRRRAVTIVAPRRGDRPPSIVHLLDDPDPVVAETAAWACGERDPAEEHAARELARVATGHPEHLVREAAVAALGAIGDPIGLPAVLAALDERATLRRRAVVALAAFDGPEVDAALHRALEDRDRQVRQIAEDLLA